MKLVGHSIATLLVAAMGVTFGTVPFSPAEAQSYRQYCHERAQRLSGYRSGNDVMGGAVRGALGGAVVGSIIGSDRRARQRGAALGAIIGGAKAANRPNHNAARIYSLEFDDCMRRR